MEQYAYIRVSTKEQNVERQIFAFGALSYSKEKYLL